MSLPWELVAEVDVTSNTTQVDFTGLSYTSDDELLLVVDNVGNGGGLYLCANGSTTLTNYDRQAFAAQNTTISSSQGNSPLIALNAVNDLEQVYCRIKLDEAGYFVAQSTRKLDTIASDIEIGDLYISSTFTTSSITQINVLAGSANGIGAGSKYKLYKLNAELLADVNVSVATTSVDITGLSLTSDNEVMLISDSPYTSGLLSIYFNNNTTATNYYTQIMFANHTSNGTARYNNPYLTFSNRILSMCDIKLTNNDYCCFKSNHLYFYGGTTEVRMARAYGSSTFTATSITQLTITHSVSNGIVSGSRFKLYKLK